MRIRPYIANKDYECLSKWIDNERTHAFWCANLLPYPMTPKSFHDFLEKNAMDWTDGAYIATENSGQAAGFFCYSVNTENNMGFLKFVIVDSTKRKKGYGKEMLNLALQYAFQITGAETVQLNVFNENILAKQCYKKAGFIERNIDKDVFSYQDELWSRCNMVVSKQSL
ncbi:MAG TPA: GNAT family N-acetyltransferase [Candidatus Eisenbergiella merdigallinarum]|uniref:GNAT family N-acetyltransferase n=1 Tax=Candidatus Eisenbergiella merdigallinarum TaxID=2838552 RepID=A0A9D2MQH2_9FIRM|nr:GNAT family N-acetyltransferase [Candidatus Eisenbergiella merdigallinarum]